MAGRKMSDVIVKEISSHEWNILQVLNLELFPSPVSDIRHILVNMYCLWSGENGIKHFDSLPSPEIMEDILDKSLFVLWT